MSTSQPLVSIIIPTHNRRNMLLRLLKSIFASTYKTIEIVVVDDASIDGTADAIQKMFARNKAVRLVRNRTNLFAAGSRNAGSRKAIGKYFFYIDDDNVIERNAIEELVNVFESDEAIGELGLVNYSFTDKNTIFWLCTKRDMCTSRTYQSRNLREFSKQKFWETVDVPNAFMVRADIIKKYGISFCEKLGIMYEESDVAYRIRNAGYNILVVRDAKIYHDAEDSFRHFMDDVRRPYVFARNRIIFHSLYSTTPQFLSILCIWIWVFTVYYCYQYISYSGSGNFSFTKRFQIVLQYLRGDAEGLLFVIQGEKLYYPRLI